MSAAHSASSSTSSAHTACVWQRRMTKQFSPMDDNGFQDSNGLGRARLNTGGSVSLAVPFQLSPPEEISFEETEQPGLELYQQHVSAEFSDFSSEEDHEEEPASAKTEGVGLFRYSFSGALHWLGLARTTSLDESNAEAQRRRTSMTSEEEEEDFLDSAEF